MEELVARIQAIINRAETSRHLILQDELTQVYNRRYLQNRLQEEISRGRRSGSRFSVALLDVDSFKQINDAYGHAVGDETLQCIVARMKKNIRTSDIICRYGGDEFVLILPDTLLEVANLVLQRLRESIAKDTFVLPKSARIISVTCSIGVVAFPEDGETGEELLHNADSALYQAKSKGRNSVQCFRK